MKDAIGYNLENPEDLYNFSRDCEEACCKCPQYSPWNPIDFDEGRNEVSPSKVFMWWKQDEGGRYLFHLGYCVELDEEARDTFSRYINCEDEMDSDVIDLHTGKLLSNKPMSILIFTGT